MKLLLPFHLQKVGAGFPSPATDYVEDDIDPGYNIDLKVRITYIFRRPAHQVEKKN